MQLCSECALNWHMKRKAHLLKFYERWGEETESHIRDMLDSRDVLRINHNLTWAKNCIEKIESEGVTFKKTMFGDRITEVLIAVYEALCCVAYLSDPEQRETFQYVFARLQGKKSYLKLGAKDPLPGMTYFLFDQKNEDRRNWAFENWKNVEAETMTEEQFDWAISGGLVNAMDDVHRKLQTLQTNPSPETYLEVERFWLGFESVLQALNESLILGSLGSMDLKANCPPIYDLLLRQTIPFTQHEGVLVVALRVLTKFLQKSPTAFWNHVGSTRPNVVTDIIFTNPVYSSLLRQSLEDFDACPGDVPFPVQWIAPWLKSMGQDRRYDACEVLLHTLFQKVADPGIGEPGQTACTKAGLDALTFTMQAFVTQDISGTGTTHVHSNCTLNLVMKHKAVLLSNLQQPLGEHVGWDAFKVGQSAYGVVKAAMELDMKLFSVDFHTFEDGGQIQSAFSRDSAGFWKDVIDVYEASTDKVNLAKDFLVALEPLIRLEQIRPRKKDPALDDARKKFNDALKSTTDILSRIFTRISNLDEMDLTAVFDNNKAFQVTVGVAMRGDSDVAEAAAELLKEWTQEISRGQALEHVAQDHPEKILGATLFALDHVFRGPSYAAKTKFPWDPIRPILHMSRDVLRGLCDMTTGVLRTKTLEPRTIALLLRWWQAQWHFVQRACSNIELWSLYIANSVMQEFCREIMELAEALVAEDGLLISVVSKANNKSEGAMAERVLQPVREHFQGLENMIRLKDKWLVDVTVRVLCKIVSRLREIKLEIPGKSRQFIIDACVPKERGRYARPTNMTDQQRAELLQALGHVEEEVKPEAIAQAEKKQSKLDAWSKSGPAPGASRSNRDDVMEFSKSIDSPILKQLEARRINEAKAKSLKPVAKKPDQRAITALKESRKREKAELEKRKQMAIAEAKRVRGEAGGVLGKDHSKSEIMVNSSEEESEGEEDSDDGDDQLAMLSTGTKKTVDEAEKARLQALRDRARRPVKKVKQQRSVKEMRARLVPPMEKLHNTILAWEIFHNGNDPPSGPSGSKVATSYTDPASYQQTFFPLLASEAWRSFVTAKDEITNRPFGIKVASRASVDSFLEVTFTMPVSQNKERGVFEGDILLVSEAENPLTDPHVKHCLARVHRIKYKKDLIEATFRVASRNNQLSQLLNPGVSVHGVKITNMTTIEREYAALESLQYYDLMDEILKAEPSPVLRYGEEKIQKWSSNWELNRGQAMAVMGAQDNDGFTLIQGPPGTGKTKTIVAMVGALLSEQLSNQTSGTAIARPGPGTAQHANGTLPKKLLVCAPSNAAVDELVLRLKNGVKGVSGKHSKINVLRLGRSDAINAAVRDVTLDELVKNRLEGDGTKDKAVADRDKLHADAGKIKEELSELRPMLDAARGGDKANYDKLSRRFDELKGQQMQIGRQIDANKDSGNSVAREMEMRRRQVQQEILNGAHVICATLSGSGHEMFRNLDVEFETVIIDEAAQCVELSALIPLKYGCCKCILVGDPKQLPPTVLSQSAARFGYDQSLFVRMQQNHPKSVHLLDMQYRMHPEISAFPSREFYEGQLKDGQDMAPLRQQPWHRTTLLSPYRFFDVQGVQERGHKGQSLVNNREIEVALQMYERFSSDYRDLDLKQKIGIITPYKAQLFELRNRFRNRYGEGISDIIEFNTTDAFQGRECEIIIFSCVRASSTGGIGFMTDIRRMNVGLTRAKSSLWILGDSRALVQGEFWKKLIEDSRARDRYTDGDVLSKFRKTLELNPNAPAYPPPSRASTPRKDGDGDIAMRPAPASAPEHAPRSGGLPVIHTSKPPPSGPGESKKRPLDASDSGESNAKRVCASSPPSTSSPRSNTSSSYNTPKSTTFSNTATESERWASPRRHEGQVWPEAVSEQAIPTSALCAGRPVGQDHPRPDAPRPGRDAIIIVDDGAEDEPHAAAERAVCKSP
ncbi:putative SEN1 protein [Emericellopsis atlantica]|uniref:SEN1 protein n=1 Tax=Emericellopsis atlantica TaxID=2614577 RepID=A0A9P7ZV64_9HYPO|nr:putative SEN1 protein [Emericellopsis atlantica]KAG9258671.1 putative SEN1 protein [Emericellopsis atlantica]